MNTLTLRRLTRDDRPTIGVLSHGPVPLSFCVEDRYREGPKVKGDTRIPEGTYPLRWRAEGRWARRFQAMGYPGSLEICEIPDFAGVLLHIGNDRGDTEGCPLPNLIANLATRNGGQSRDACSILYDRVKRYEGEWEIKVE